MNLDFKRVNAFTERERERERERQRDRVNNTLAFTESLARLPKESQITGFFNLIGQSLCVRVSHCA